MFLFISSKLFFPELQFQSLFVSTSIHYSSCFFQGGWRAKLKARDDNEIDTMFIDKRTSDDDNGQILVG